jgi:hypothetical protein
MPSKLLPTLFEVKELVLIGVAKPIYDFVAHVAPIWHSEPLSSLLVAHITSLFQGLFQSAFENKS